MKQGDRFSYIKNLLQLRGSAILNPADNPEMGMRKLVSLLLFGIYDMSLKICRMNYSFTTNVFYTPAHGSVPIIVGRQCCLQWGFSRIYRQNKQLPGQSNRILST